VVDQFLDLLDGMASNDLREQAILTAARAELEALLWAALRERS
jgi:hypothetical protein